MRAMVTGVSAWQQIPTSGVLDVEIPVRYTDSSGNATVSRYSAILDTSTSPPRWMNAQNPLQQLWLVVQGPDDPPAVQATFREVLSYGTNKSVTTTFKRKLVSSDLDGLIFDYAEPEPVNPEGFGDAPLTMRAAAQLLEQGQDLVIQQQAQLADNAQSPKTLRHGTRAERRALSPLPDNRTFWLEDDTRITLTYYPNVGWRDVYGNDPDAAPPPPDTGGY